MQAILSRIIAPFLAGLVAWLAGKGIDMGTDAEAFINGATVLILAIFMALYGVFHKLIDRKINPMDDTK